MIDAKELRIGNIVEYKGSYVKITADDFAEFDKNLLVIANPIPLNEDLLDQFGFEYDEKHDVYYFHPLALEINDDITFTFNYPSHIKIESVHQLQNLFFCLCGKELTIK